MAVPANHPGTNPGAALVVRGGAVVIDGDPLADIGVLAEPGRHLRVVVQGGRVVVDRR